MGINQRRARPVRAGVAAVDVREHVRRHEVTEPRAYRPRVFQLFLTDRECILILDRTANIAELPVSQNTGYPTAVELPVITAADGPVPAPATLALLDADRANSGRWVDGEGVGLPEAVTEAAEEVEAGPVLNRLRHHRCLGIGPRGKVGCQG